MSMYCETPGEVEWEFSTLGAQNELDGMHTRGHGAWASVFPLNANHGAIHLDKHTAINRPPIPCSLDPRPPQSTWGKPPKLSKRSLRIFLTQSSRGFPPLEGRSTKPQSFVWTCRGCVMADSGWT